MRKKQIHDILRIYREWDRVTLCFQRTTGIRCPQGCGLCCESRSVEATVLECLPLAHAIHRGRESETILSAIQEKADQGDLRCVLYQSIGESSGTGRCGCYPYRPLICRLFGFSTRRNKRGERELCLCRVFREGNPAAPGSLEGKEIRAMVLPVYQDSFMRIATLDPGLGTRLFPINEALRQALEDLLWKQSLSRISVIRPRGPISTGSKKPAVPPMAGQRIFEL